MIPSKGGNTAKLNSDKKYVFGIDAGTNDLRAIVFNNHGHEIVIGRSAYEIISPKPGWFEQKAEWWWNALIKAVRNAISNSGIDPDYITALCVTHQRETIIPINKEGAPLYNAILWMDSRATEQADWLKERIGTKKVLEITGLPPDSTFSLEKILWIKEKYPEVFRKTYKWLLVHDFLVYKLTGKFATSWASACTTGAFDIRKSEWAKELLEFCDIPIETLPKPFPPGKVIGKVSKQASKATGLPEDLVVTSGGGDQQCGALGCGVTESGLASINLGTSCVIETFSERPPIDPELRYFGRIAAIPGNYVAEAAIKGGGLILRWFRDNFGDQEKKLADACNLDPYDILTLEATAAPPGALGLMLVPYWLGCLQPYWDRGAKGIIIGVGVAHKRSHFIRCILEGVAYEVRKNIELMEDGIKSKISELRIYGGGSRSHLWNQIIADVTGKRAVIMESKEATSLGAAILAAKAGGLYKDIAEATRSMTRVKEKFEPNLKNHTLYSELYKEGYRSLFDQTRNIVDKISSITGYYT
jgi:D-xylulose kinase